MNSASYKTKYIYGLLLIVPGIAALAFALVFKPAFVSRYFSPDHNLATSTIQSINSYRYTLSFVGILLIASGSILITVKNIGEKIQKIISVFHFKKMDEKRSGKTSLVYDVLFFGIIGIMGVLLILWMTPFGAGTFDDSLNYIGGAKRMLLGNGYSFYNGSPITLWPPLYPLFLAATDLWKNNLIQAARFLGALLFGVNLILFGLAIHWSSARNYLTTTLAVFILLSSASLLELHSSAMSEPLFITFSLACIILLSLYTIRPTLLLLIASSLSLGFGIVTRYIGCGFLPAAAVLVFIGAGSQKPKRRFRNTLIWLVLACAPMVIFFARNMLVAGTASGRILAVSPDHISTYFEQIIPIVFNLIIPIPLPGWVGPTFLGLLAASLPGLVIILLKRHLRNNHSIEINWPSMGSVVAVTCFLFFVSYLLFLLIMMSFSDPVIPVQERLLTPILIIMTLGIFSVTWNISQALKNKWVWRYFLAFIFLFMIIRAPYAIRLAADIHRNGLGYTSRQWRDSESIAFIRSLGEDGKIYSNGPEILGVWTERGVQYMPAKTISNTTNENPLYDQEIASMCKDIRENGALLVYFNSIEPGFPSSPEEIKSTCPLTVLHNFPDGIIYGER